MLFLMVLCITAIGLFNALLIKRAFKRGKGGKVSSDFEQSISLLLNGVLIIALLWAGEIVFKKEAYVGILKGNDNPYTYKVEQTFSQDGTLLKSDTIYVKRGDK